jgi:RNA polymerase sigma-70 factor (ECF subfamily)
MEERTEEQQALARLLARIALRDRSAFERLYQQVNGKLNSVALAIVGQQALADDVLQDAFMQIWHNAGSYHEELGTPLVWMRAIVRYRAFDQLSQQKRKRQLTGDDPADHPVEGVNAMSIANATADRQILDICLQTLTASSRESILLAYLFGYSREEIAERMLKPLNTIKSWLKRGLERLEKCLRQNAI